MRRRVDEAATPSGVAPRNAVRGFRVDRIRSLQVTTATFAPTHATDVARDLERWNAAPLN
jgi:predicted DNA-binding transcriptional regulator YafY